MFNTNSFSAPMVYTRGAMRELPPHDFAVLEGKNLSEARQGYDFIAYNPIAFRQLLGPQPIIRELHRREDKFAHEVSTAIALHLMTRTELWESCLTLFPEVRACCQRCTPLYCYCAPEVITQSSLLAAFLKAVATRFCASAMHVLWILLYAGSGLAAGAEKRLLHQQPI